VTTSNRAVEDKPSLVDDPMLGNNTLDQLTSASY